MNNKNTRRKILLFVVAVGLLGMALVLPAIPKPCVRSQRVSTVNHVASVSMALPSTNR